VKFWRKIIRYLHPLHYFGRKPKSVVFPLALMLLVIVASEWYAFSVVGDPNAVGQYAIYLFFLTTIYLSFHHGTRGGLISALATGAYYGYIIYDRGYGGQQFQNAVELTLGLVITHLLLATAIGWLKRNIDDLIRKEAEERRHLESIMHQLPVGIMITDNKGIIRRTNKQLERLVGLRVAKGDNGKNGLLTGTEADTVFGGSGTPIRKTLRTGKPVRNEELTLSLPEGRKVHLRVNAAPIINNRMVAAAVASVDDITERKEIEARKDDFVNMASHELKTPVTSLKLYLDYLDYHLEQYGDKKAVTTIRNIENQIEKLQNIINDLLDVSRLTTGKLSYEFEEFDLGELIRDTITIFRDTNQNRQISYQNGTPLPVMADRFRIYQVATNLITNALKYSPAGSEVKITAGIMDNKAVVSVQDYGIGIRKDQQKRIFDRLYQVTDSVEKTFPGLGMGLYISKEIIMRHKGKIWVESQKGKGSTFYFSLPVRNRRNKGEAN
jgi:two-component system, OmpR family, phosphate regulon sensor histidine kinase PhoR